jgi:isopentenyl-diphosphate delta-isomerase
MTIKTPQPPGVRKADHLRIVLEETVEPPGVMNGFEQFRFDHDALPEIDREDVSIETTLFGKPLHAPLIIGAMTGGTNEAGAINRVLAEAAEERGIAMALGSQRIMLEDATTTPSFQLRDIAPTIPLIGNIGAIQLNYGVSTDDIRRLIDQTEVDALMLHLNPLQEAIQPGGDTRFAGLADKIGLLAETLDCPLLVKEVGAGLSERTAGLLAGLPIAGVETAGVGGTSWALVESFRTEDATQREAGRELATWGVPTAESLLICREAFPDRLVIASGGIRTGVEIAKAIALGADAVALAGPLLHAANRGVEPVLETLDALTETLKTILFVTGSRDLDQLEDHAVLRYLPEEHA